MKGPRKREASQPATDPLTGPPEALPNFCFCPRKNSGNFLRKEPHIACRGHRGHFEADLEAAEVIEIDLEADLEAAEADLEAAQGHLRLPINLAYMKTIQKRFSDSQQKSSF